MSAEELLQALEGGDMEGAEQLQPTIITNHNIDPADVEEWWAGHLNDAWAEKVNAKIREGFITIRVQTEFQGLNNGHATKIYMAKMK